MKNKKGFLYTLGLSLVLLALLSLGLLFLRQASLEKERNAENALSLKAWDKYTSINKAISDMFINTGIFLNSSAGTATFKETLTHDFSKFDANMDIFIENVEGNFSNTSIKADEKFFKQDHRVLFFPMGIIYTHFESANEEGLANEINVKRNIAIRSFNITLTFPEAVNCLDQGSNDDSSPNADSMSITLTILPTPTDAVCLSAMVTTHYFSFKYRFTEVSSSKQVELKIDNDVSGPIKDQGKFLQLKTITDAVIINSSITIGFDELQELGYFETDINISISEPKFVSDITYNINKTGRVLFPLPPQN